ncbi:MAG: hypothetical protein WCB46_08350 [Methanoregula sp.]
MNRREERSCRSSGCIVAEHHKTEEKTMKTTDYFQEAHQASEKNPKEPDKTMPYGQKENEELRRARRHGAEGVAEQTEPPPSGRPESAMPSQPEIPAVFRKTELYDRPLLFRSEEPQLKQNPMPDPGPDAEVPYGLFEVSLRDLVRSMIRRQETMGQGLAKEAGHLHDRLDILEDHIELTIDRMDRRICSLEEERGP